MGAGDGVSKRNIVILCLLVAALIATAIIVGLLIPARRRNDDLQKHFRNAAITTDAAECASVGKDILLRNGSAVDSAIATLLCMGVVTPQSMGIGGAFLMTVYIRDKNIVDVLDAREMAPGDAKPDMYQGKAAAASLGGLSIAIPGEIKGLYEAHAKYGRLPWSTLFTDAINISRNGFPVGKHLANAIKMMGKIAGFQNLREFLTNKETQTFYREGEIMKNPKLAETLQVIASKGADAFYEGGIADSLIQDISKAGGIIKKDDFFKYKARWMDAVRANISNLVLYSCPPPGSGALLAFMLKALEGFHFQTKDSDSLLFYHRVIETFKFAFAKRGQLEDSDSPGVKALVEKLLSVDFADKARNRISDETTFDDPAHYGMKVDGKSDWDGTSHMAVIAANGDAVSVTSSINSYFGSKVRSASTGIILNNGMDDFSVPGIASKYGIQPSRANQIAPYKRPFSSMSPTIFLDSLGNVKLAIGGNGGTQISTGIALVASRLIFLGESIKKSIDSPRVHDQLSNKTFYEQELSNSTIEGLQKLGHVMTKLNRIGSVILGIVRGRDDQLYPYADPRKGGNVDGY